MSKDPTPRADALQAMREQRYGHLQATAEPAKMGRPKLDKPPRKLIPYAGKDSTGIAPPEKPGAVGGKMKPGRVRVKRKRRTALPPEKATP